MSSLLPSNIYPAFCDFVAPSYLFFSENVPALVYYSHLPISFIALALGIYVLLKKNSIASWALFALTLSFSTWVLLDSVFWASNRGDVIMFVWSLQILFEPIIYISAFYLLHTLLTNKPLPFSQGIIIALLYLPVILFIPTKLMLYGFDENTCLSLEGPLATFYTYGIEFVILLWLLLFALKTGYTQKNRRGEILLLTTAISCLLLMFSLGNILSSFTGNWRLAQIGLFAMPVFISLFVYSIVKYQTFKIKLFSTVALVFALIGLNFSLLFITDLSVFRLLSVVILVLTVVFGILLIRAVKHEVQQREQIENLAKGLEKANARLRELDKQKSEFVSVASHQLRSPLAAIRGYASMLVEGSFGKVDDKMSEPLNRIADSARLMAESVEDFLSVSRIEGGNMRYELADFDLSVLTEDVTSDLRGEGFKKGLLLLYKSTLKTKGTVKADKGKVQQILHNLINNALKYTPKGTISVHIHDDPKTKKVYVDIIDTGIGMSEDTIDSLFSKFTRAKNANEVNIKGTGLGLFVAREMARAMGGEVSAHSEGEGKGSRFELVLPLIT